MFIVLETSAGIVVNNIGRYTMEKRALLAMFVVTIVLVAALIALLIGVSFYQKELPWTPSVIPLITALGGVLIGSFLSSLLARDAAARDAQMKRTIEIFERFNGAELHQARHLAYHAFMDRAGSPISINKYREERDEYWIAISTVLHYFDTLENLIAAKLVDEELVGRLLGRQIASWVNSYILSGDYILIDSHATRDEPHPLRAGLQSLAKRNLGNLG